MAVLTVLLLSALLATTGSAARDEDFEEFDDDEAEFDFDVSDENVEGLYKRLCVHTMCTILACTEWLEYGIHYTKSV